MVEISLKVKEGWKLQSDPIKLNKILNSIVKYKGGCPCQITHPQCSCKEYLENNNCHCKLYIKDTDTDQGDN